MAPHEAAKTIIVALLLLINSVRSNSALGPLELVGGVCQMDCNSAKQVSAQWADANEWGTLPSPIRFAMLELGWGPLQWRTCNECYHGNWNQSSHGPFSSLAECVVQEYTAGASPAHCPMSHIKLFGELSAVEKAAAESLGYTEMIWDSNSPYSCCFDGYLKRGNPEAPQSLHGGASSTSARAARIIGPALLLFCMLLGLLIAIAWIMRRRKTSREANNELQGVTVAAHSAASIREEDEQEDEMDTVDHHSPVPGSTKTCTSSGISSNDALSLGLDHQLGQDVEVLEYIGQGGASKVFKGSWQGTTVAVKVCNMKPNQVEVDDGKITKGSPFIRMEAAMAAKFRHPNVVRLHACNIDPPNAAKLPNLSPQGIAADSDPTWQARIIVEYCENGSLRSALHQGLLEGQEGRPVQPDLDTALALSYDMACGMVYLHTLQIVHGDLKAENVLLSPRKHRPGGSKSAAKIADFGLANGNLHVKQEVPSYLSGAIKGPLNHIAPECLHVGHVSKAADVYAFGILMYELMTAKRAWEGMSSEEILEAVRDNKQCPTFPKSTPPYLLIIAMSCLSPEPMERPSMEDIKAAIRTLCLSCGIWPQSNGDLGSVDLESRSASGTSSNGSLLCGSGPSEAAPSSQHDPACLKDTKNSEAEAAMAEIRVSIELSSSEGQFNLPITRRESSFTSVPGIYTEYDDWQQFYLSEESQRAGQELAMGGETGPSHSNSMRRQRALPARSSTWHPGSSSRGIRSRLSPLEISTPSHGENDIINERTSMALRNADGAGSHSRHRRALPAKRHSSWSTRSPKSVELPTIMDKPEADFDTVPDI